MYGFDREYGNIYWNMGIYISDQTHIQQGMYDHWQCDHM